MSITVTDATLDAEIDKNQDKVILVDFWADWCGPCHVLAPTLERLEADFQGKLVVLKVDVDANPLAADAFGIQGLPTLVLFDKGEPLDMISGVIPFHNLKAIVEKYIS